MIGIEFFLKKKGIIMSNDNNSGLTLTPEDERMMKMMQIMMNQLMAQKQSVIVESDSEAKAELERRKAFEQAGFTREVKGAGTRYQRVVQTASLDYNTLTELIAKVPNLKGAITSIYVTVKDEFKP
jgi:hypothetical protein